jgi:hypothetical protein
MNIITACDTILLTERQVNDAIADAIKKATGRVFDHITNVRVFDCGAIGVPEHKLLNITVTLKD